MKKKVPSNSRSPRGSRRERPDRGSSRRDRMPARGERSAPPRGPAAEDRRRPRFSLEVAVLYEDDAVIVVDKPAGLLAVPIKGSDTPSVLSLLIAEMKLKRQRALVVHRIDRFASGILLFAKTNPGRDALVKQFLSHTPGRQYLAVVRGHLEDESGTLVHYFRRGGVFQQLRGAQDPTATRAELHYSVERLFPEATLVRVELVTGLQNQIRAQFAAMGHPLIGDRKYHPEEASEQLIARVALHAAHLQFVHPRTGESIEIDCKPPQDFQYLVRELARGRGRDRRG
jgi:23S rRNA pseudouridine1911/1915/1917 synthase